jgi:hypothetical protein
MSLAINHSPLFSRRLAWAPSVAGPKAQSLRSTARRHVGRDRGLEGAMLNLTSTYILRDIARCCALALHYTQMRLKRPSIGLNRTGGTSVVLMELPWHAHHEKGFDNRSDSWLDFISYIVAIQHRLIVTSKASLYIGSPSRSFRLSNLSILLSLLLAILFPPTLCTFALYGITAALRRPDAHPSMKFY